MLEISENSYKTHIEIKATQKCLTIEISRLLFLNETMKVPKFSCRRTLQGTHTLITLVVFVYTFHRTLLVLSLL